MPEDQTNFCALEVRDAAVVTSGQLTERFFTADDGAGVRPHPRPAHGARAGGKRPQVRDPSIGAEEGKKCDALSTALFVMGRDAANRTLADIWGL